MNENPRYYILSAERFDGTTPLVSGWLPDNNQNRPRHVAQQDVVGRLSFANLARPGTSGCVVLVRRWSGEGEGEDKVQVRSVSATETTDSPTTTTLDSLLESTPLLSTWSRPLFLGPTDAIAPFHLPDGGGTIELLVADELGDLLRTHIQTAQAQAQATSSGGLASITLDGSAVLEVPATDIVVFVNTASGTITLPDFAEVQLGRRFIFVRQAADAGNSSDPPQIIAPDPFNDQVNTRTGATVTPYLLLRQGDSVTYTRVPSGWAHDRGVSSPVVINSGGPTTPLFPFQDGTQYVELQNGGDVIVPIPATCGRRVQIVILNAHSTARATLKTTPEFTINGVDEIAFGAGAVALLENTGTNGWYAVITGGQNVANVSSGLDVAIPSWVDSPQFVQTTGPAGQTATLPDAATVKQGAFCIHWNPSGNAHVLAAAGAQTINGAATIAVAAGKTVIAYRASAVSWRAIIGA